MKQSEHSKERGKGSLVQVVRSNVPKRVVEFAVVVGERDWFFLTQYMARNCIRYYEEPPTDPPYSTLDDVRKDVEESMRLMGGEGEGEGEHAESQG